MTDQNYQNLYKKLQEEKTEISIKDLQVHQKRRALILVSDTLDITDVAVLVALDDKKSIENWLSKNLIENVEDDQFKKMMHNENKIFSFIIVQPFVLIQYLRNLQ
tara:strand:- start:2251 stop:2565 length:315 start_codon:yes stop_codon:yes gene_type:complete